MAYRYDYYGPEPVPTYYSAPLEPPPGRTYIYTPPGSPPPRNNFEYGSSPYGNEPRYQEHQREYIPPPITVPTEPQGFHPELGSQYQFQYSQCTGKRKALIIGINYIGSKNQLNGCINDAHNISLFMNQQYGYAYDDMVILTDDQTSQLGQPTRDNIIRAMNWLVEDARPHDSLFFHYSGHGGQAIDEDGDHIDGYDETIFPVDFQQTSQIISDEMHAIMVRPLPTGCRLTAVYDCCHSGSALDLPYEYGHDGLLKEPDLLHEAAHGLLGVQKSYVQGDMRAVLTAGTSLVKLFTTTNEVRESIRQTKTSPADVIQLSGCKNYQTSADANIGGQSTGAMSWAFREVLTRQPNQSYKSLLVNIRALLATKYEQKPVLSSSHPIDTRLQYIM